MLPQGFTQLNLAPHWLRNGNGRNFCDAVCPQGLCAKTGLAPKTITTPEYKAVANYAYHLDAGKFAPFLQRHCTDEARRSSRARRRVRGPALRPSSGDIDSLMTAQAGEISGDLFVDCTGFAALLLGKTLGVGFKDCSDILFCDTALAVQVPYDTPDAPIASHTISVAQKQGGSGTSGCPRGAASATSTRAATAARRPPQEVLRRYIGPQHKERAVRKIPIRSGHRETFWKNNCVGVGLAAGFLEPLESSAIVLIELSAKLIAEQLPANREVMDIVAARFNEVTGYRWGRIIDFLKLHYVLTQENRQPFLDGQRRSGDRARAPQESAAPVEIPVALVLRRVRPLGRGISPGASYQYVLYGMGFRTEVGLRENPATESMAAKLFKENITATRQMRAQLPKNRELLRKIFDYGLHPI